MSGNPVWTAVGLWVAMSLPVGESRACDDDTRNAAVQSEFKVERLVYKTWRGVSPGAGFISTETRVLEIDFVRKRYLHVRRRVHRPEPLTPSTFVNAEFAAEDSMWRELSAEDQVAALKAINGWLATDPPAQGKSYRHVGGREDGYTASLSVETSEGQHRVVVNPPGQRAEDRMKPSHAYNLLFELLDRHRWTNDEPFRFSVPPRAGRE